MPMTTVRLSTRTRDKLNEVARANQRSAAAQLAKLVDDAWWEAACASERAAAAADRLDPETQAEGALWDRTVGDGLAEETTDSVKAEE
ncbi:MAG: hypothetical protein LBE08_06700 [Bifidobacteriaceae bacterium]|jgi:predicted transcriptional regulator|nr:hypothetical protein [Bifidobacteriaceae bacterium]